MRAARQWAVRHAGALEALYRWFLRAAPVLRRGVGWLGVERSERWLRPVEREAKGLLFDCHMCGRCALSYTGMACPMNCPKRHRNGPCGGVRPDGGCEVDAAMRCVWLDAHDGARRMSDPDALRSVHAPVDHARRGRSAWMRTILGEDEAPRRIGRAAPALRDAAPAPGTLGAAFAAGRFVVTAELSPPDGADPGELLQRAARLRGKVDALNLTDGAGAHAHMSSIAAAALLAREGHTPVFQIACRDRNRIAVQADILGAAALGLRNLLCVTGDHVAAGDHPDARPVFDLDSVSLLGIARGLRDDGVYASGRAIGARPPLFLGATTNPFVPPFEDRIVNLERKIAAGAQFVVTQYCLDPGRLERFVGHYRARGLDRVCRLVIGVGPLTSVRMARWMASRVPGVHVPPEVLARIEAARDPVAEGLRICLEVIARVRMLPGVSGVHIMAHRREDLAAAIIDEAGLAPPADEPCAAAAAAASV